MEKLIFFFFSYRQNWVLLEIWNRLFKLTMYLFDSQLPASSCFSLSSDDNDNDNRDDRVDVVVVAVDVEESGKIMCYLQNEFESKINYNRTNLEWQFHWQY